MSLLFGEEEDEEKKPAATPKRATGPSGPPAHGVVRAEANLLRLPLFALHTKGLKTLDAIECRGRFAEEEVAHEFSFRAYRSTATRYPGPLARSAHLAFLSIATERGLPLLNPIGWTWRELCRRMGITCSGRTVERLKTAIHSTAGLYIVSSHALYSKPEGRRISTREEGLRLYERVCFLGSEMPGGGAADANYLWLSDWYLANLNALFTAPLDYALWRRLEDRSAVASRLYEFLLVNLEGGAPSLRIDYENLVQFLPVRAERHPSQARQQLGPALKLLEAAGVIASATWSGGEGSPTQIEIARGKHLEGGPASADRPASAGTDLFAAAVEVEVEELRTINPPEWTAVAEFYRLWTGDENPRPTPRELEQARALIEKHSPAKLRSMIGLAVKMMRARWPDAKAFGSLTRYMGEASAEYDREQRRLEADREEQARLRREREQREAEQARAADFETRWRPAWEALAEAERSEIRQAVLKTHPFLDRMPKMVESLCLEELARRRGEPS